MCKSVGLKATKVKSHGVDKPALIDKYKIPRMDMLGNAYADVLADRASVRHALAIGQAQPVLNEM